MMLYRMYYVADLVGIFNFDILLQQHINKMWFCESVRVVYL